MFWLMAIASAVAAVAAAYMRWKVVDLEVELKAEREESMRRQRLLEMEMVKSASLRRANDELTEQVKKVMAQKSIEIGVRVPMGRAIYFN